MENEADFWAIVNYMPTMADFYAAVEQVPEIEANVQGYAFSTSLDCSLGTKGHMLAENDPHDN